LKRVEAHLYEHEAEIARHKEQIEHSHDHAPELPVGEHDAMAKAHDKAGENHKTLMDAIFALEALL